MKMNKKLLIGIFLLLTLLMVNGIMAFNECHKKTCEENYFECITNNFEGRCFREYCFEDKYLDCYKEVYSGQDGVSGSDGVPGKDGSSSGGTSLSRIINYLRTEFVPYLEKFFVRVQSLKDLERRIDYLELRISGVKDNLGMEQAILEARRLNVSVEFEDLTCYPSGVCLR
jgi:hypothetical protein